MGEMILLIFFGIVLLYVGAEALVRSAAQMANLFRLSPFVIGVTVVALATSSPEAIVSILAQLKLETGDLSLGTIIGSNIANIGLILGISALISPCKIPKKVRWQEMPVLVAIIGLIYLVGREQIIQRTEGIALLAALFIYVLFVVLRARGKALPPDRMIKTTRYPFLYFFLGAGCLYFGATFFLRGSLSLALYYGMPEKVIGLTLIALGTSLPELATSVVAAIRKQEEIYLGNVLGSNIYNPLLVIALASLVKPVVFESTFLSFDLPVLFGFTLVLWAMTLLSKRLGRTHGAVLVLGYLLYITNHLLAGI